MAVGSLTTLLSSCTNLKAPKTLFITYAVEQSEFKVERARVRAVIDKYTKAFQRSNPDTRIIYITYTSKEYINQITKDTKLDLGADLMIAHQFSAAQLAAHNLTEAPPDTQYFDAIYSPRIQSAAKINNEYTFVPWLMETQIACFNNTKIQKPPSTIQDLEQQSSSGKKIGLSSQLYELIWTAGTQGAIAEISTLGDKIRSETTYPAIRQWLAWLQKAALYQNIYFVDNHRDLKEKLMNNELDWVTCYSSQIEELKTNMGSSLGIAALPNGATSKAFPTNAIYGFALGKNSSQSQRKTALKLIKTNVNTIAQRKLQLDDIGFLAVNQNVSIPPESSKKLAALNTSFNEQSNVYSKEWPGVLRWFFPEKRNSKNYLKQYKQLSSTLTELTDGYLDVDEALKVITTTKTN